MNRVWGWVRIAAGTLAAVAALFLIWIQIDAGELRDAAHVAAEMATFCSGQEVTPQAFIARHNLGGGMTATRFVELLAGELPGDEVHYEHDQSDAALLRAIHEQLARGVPAPVFFGSANPFNPPHYDFHTSVVTGLDLDAGVVSIYNVYGYEEDVTLCEFLNRMSYRGTARYPLVQKAVLKLGLMDRNAMVVVREM